MPRPDHFVIVGAQRCGTSYLYRLLDEHPEIQMAKPLRPEPKFFLDEARFALGVAHYEADYFSADGPRMRGEKSTSYLGSAVAIDRITAALPGVHLVVVLRDPVQRAVSHYRFTVQHGHESLPLPEALRSSAEGARPWDPTRFSVSPFDYVPRGRYADALEPLGRAVTGDRLHVVMFEELVTERGVLADLYDALGVDRSFEPADLRPANASEGAVEPMDLDLQAWLRDYYREPNKRLETFLGRALPWPT